MQTQYWQITSLKKVITGSSGLATIEYLKKVTLLFLLSSKLFGIVQTMAQPTSIVHSDASFHQYSVRLEALGDFGCGSYL